MNGSYQIIYSSNEVRDNIQSNNLNQKHICFQRQLGTGQLAVNKQETKKNKNTF